MPEDPFASLSFIAGPAILTNASAILQNGATTRYNLAILQWREFRAALAAGDGGVARQYVAPAAAVALARRRIRLQLFGLSLLNAAVALFAATTVLGLAGALLVQARGAPAPAVGLVLTISGSSGLVALLAATVFFFLESNCGGALLRLHREFGAPADAQTADPSRPA
ncbi:hypothetical protein [Phenylobacterium sp.]|uniref:hypothetical protein n=1 Tax=Phenylobacterium sp. TaxID=1871053 RepID=UPI0035B4032E